MTNSGQDVLNIDIGWLHVGALGLPAIIVVAIIIAEAARIEQWACDFFGVQTILFQALHIFFVVRHINREILHVAVTPYPARKMIIGRCATATKPKSAALPFCVGAPAPVTDGV